MAYNLFSVKRLKEGTKKKLDSFAQTLGPAIARGEQISFADQDITNYIRLQHERIEEKGLTMEYEVYDRDKLLSQIFLPVCIRTMSLLPAQAAIAEKH